MSQPPEAQTLSPAAIAARFVEPAWIEAVQPLGNGQINDTYLVRLQPGASARVEGSAGFGQAFVLQRLNAEVFEDPAEVIANHRIVEAHVNRRLRAGVPALAGRRWELPELLPPRQGDGPAVVVAGDHWRALRFIEGAHSVEVIAGPEQAHQVGVGLGMFHLLISDLPVERLADTLEGFHITPAYLARYDALRDQDRGSDPAEGSMPAEWQRLRRWCEAFIEERRSLAPVLEQARAAGLLPLRPIHGDPKVNNLLLDPRSGAAIALIDLDTVKPGLVHYDIGDCLRSGCNPLGEETTAFEAVQFDADLFEAILSGYLSVARSFLTEPDWEALLVAPQLLAFELGLRFYTDHLEGDVYFRTQHPRHNLDRALVQFHLVASIEAQQERLAAIVAGLR